MGRVKVEICRWTEACIFDNGDKSDLKISKLVSIPFRYTKILQWTLNMIWKHLEEKVRI